MPILVKKEKVILCHIELLDKLFNNVMPKKIEDDVNLRLGL
jgi:hypothetical protein